MSEVNREDEIQGQIIHEYDGIEEADNDLPKWWLWIFYGSIVFAVGYWFYYHEYEMGPLPREAYAKQMAEKAAEGGDVSPELLATLAQDETTLSAGRQIFENNCVVCHKEQGQGDIGPNLTDAYWIHGGSAMDIYHTIAEGVQTAGMPSWEGPLGPKGVQQVTAYVMSIRGTNVEGKEPEGEKWVPGADSAAEASATERSDGGATGGAASDGGAAQPQEGATTPQEGAAASEEEEGAPAPDEGAPPPQEGTPSDTNASEGKPPAASGERPT